MAITKKSVEMLGGTINVSSTEGVGSEFDVCLTFKLDGKKRSYEKIESLQGLRVLVADDDTDTCLNVTAFCEKPLFMSELKDLLTKPIQIDEMLRVISKVLKD